MCHKMLIKCHVCVCKLYIIYNVQYIITIQIYIIYMTECILSYVSITEQKKNACHLVTVLPS